MITVFQLICIVLAMILIGMAIDLSRIIRRVKRVTQSLELTQLARGRVELDKKWADIREQYGLPLIIWKDDKSSFIYVDNEKTRSLPPAVFKPDVRPVPCDEPKKVSLIDKPITYSDNKRVNAPDLLILKMLGTRFELRILQSQGDQRHIVLVTDKKTGFDTCRPIDFVKNNGPDVTMLTVSNEYLIDAIKGCITELYKLDNIVGLVKKGDKTND